MRALVGQEGVDLRERRRQADQVEAQAAQQRDAIGLGRGLESFALEARQDEGVDRIADPIGAADGGNGGTDGRDEGPVAGGRGEDGAGVDPFGEGGDLIGGESGRAQRHARGTVGASDSLDEEAAGGVARGDDFASASIETQAAICWPGPWQP